MTQARAELCQICLFGHTDHGPKQSDETEEQGSRVSPSQWTNATGTESEPQLSAPPLPGNLNEKIGYGITRGDEISN